MAQIVRDQIGSRMFVASSAMGAILYTREVLGILVSFNGYRSGRVRDLVKVVC